MGRAPLDSAAVAAVDSSGQAADILGLPDHLLDALWRVEAAEPAAGRHARRARDRRAWAARASAARWRARRCGRSSTRPLELARDETLPAWTGPGTLVLCSSYSGNTEETLAAYDAAGEAGAPRVVSASGGELAARARRDGVPVVPLPGGFQPRAAVGYSFVVALELAALAGAAPSARAEVEAAAELARELAAEWGPDGDEDGEAKAMARRARTSTVPVIAGPGPRGRGRLPLEVPVQREREAARRSRPSCPRPATTRSSAGPRRRRSRRSPRSSSRIPTPASARRAASR